MGTARPRLTLGHLPMRPAEKGPTQAVRALRDPRLDRFIAQYMVKTMSANENRSAAKFDQSEMTDPNAQTAYTHAALAILALAIEIGGVSLFIWNTFFHVHKGSPIDILLILAWALGPPILVTAIVTRKSNGLSRLAHVERISTLTFYGALPGLIMTLVLLLVLRSSGY